VFKYESKQITPSDTDVVHESIIAFERQDEDDEWVYISLPEDPLLSSNLHRMMPMEKDGL
jgi:hypothetical protein